MKHNHSFLFTLFLSLGTIFSPVVQASLPWEESSAPSGSYSAPEADRYITYAFEAGERRDFKTAVLFWGDYFEASPNPDPYYYVEYARDLFQANEYAQASKIWTKYFEKVPVSNMDYCQEAAGICALMRDNESAAKHWDRCLEIAAQTQTPLRVVHFPTIAHTFCEVGRLDESCNYWRQYFDSSEIKCDKDFTSRAIGAYIINNQNDDVKALYERFKDDALPDMAHYKVATFYLRLEEYKSACDVWDRYFSRTTQVIPSVCRLAAFCYIAEERFDRALAMYQMIPSSARTNSDIEKQNLLSELLTPKRNTKRHARRGAKPSKPSKPSIQRAGLRAATIHAIQVDVLSNVRAQAKALLDKVVKTEDAALTTLRDKMLTHYGTCVALEAEIKRTPHGTFSSSVPVPRASSSSGAASSSSSDASSSSAPQEVNPVTRAQQVLREIEALHKDWSRRHTLFQATRLKKANKAHFLAFAENPGSIFTLPESMNVRYLFGHEKTKPAASASLVSSSSSSYASSSSAASSSSSVGSAPRVIWRFATRHVTKQREGLKKMPAYIKDKIDLFVSEIEADPLQQRLRSGRLKSLVGAPNTFSRRVDQGNRFVYQIEETTPGKFNATILSFLDHYKNLDFSKQF